MSTIATRMARRSSTSVLRPREGYDLAADGFVAWHWTKFWRRHEAPLVRRWLKSIAPGLGLDAGAGFGPYLKDATTAGHRCIAGCILNEFARVTKRGAGCLITDVHPDHPYEKMSITTGNRTLAIETHRHALEKIVSLAAQSFKIVHCIEYGLCDLTRRPSRSLFKKIYDNSSAPIFYFLTLERR